MYWIDNPISYSIDNPKINPLLTNRAYQLLVRRGLEVIRILDRKSLLSYLYYDPNLKSIKCSKTPHKNYELFRIQDIISIGIFNSNTIYILLRNQCLIFRVDTAKSAQIIKRSFENLL